MPSPDNLCFRCDHPHAWREVCEYPIPYVTADGQPYTVPCQCRAGRGTPVKGRQGIPGAIRAAVVARDGLTCAICGRTTLIKGNGKRYPRWRLTLDHLIPVTAGGADTAENLRVVCQSCNSRRGNRYAK